MNTASGPEEPGLGMPLTKEYVRVLGREDNITATEEGQEQLIALEKPPCSSEDI